MSVAEVQVHHRSIAPKVRWAVLCRAAARQHRGSFVGAALLFLAFGAAITFEALGSHVSNQLLLQDGGVDTGRLGALDLGVMSVPALLGVFLGAPLVAREVESGTYRFTWTQSVGRTRFVLGALGFVAAASIVVAATLGALLGWYAHPYEVIGVASRWQAGFFMASPILLASWTCLGLGTGVLLGSVVRRTVPAMAATAAAVGALLAASFAYLLRALLSVAPVVTSAGSHGQIGLGELASPALPGGPVPSGSWLVRSWFVGPGRKPVSGPAANHLYSQWSAAAKGAGNAAAMHGYRFLVAYQPPGRFWLFQIVAAAVLVMLGVGAVALTIRRVRRFG
jgi:hypothetical protein